MPGKQTRASIEAIQKDMEWLRIPIEPGRCCCGHYPSPATSAWTFRQAYFCSA
jgi:hypothetical protein